MPASAVAIWQPWSLPRQKSQPAVGAADASRLSDSVGNEHVDGGTSGVADVRLPSSSAAAGTMDGAANHVSIEGTRAA